MRLGDDYVMPDGDTWRVVHFHDEPNTGLCTLERQDITKFRITLPVSWLNAAHDAIPAALAEAARIIDACADALTSGALCIRCDVWLADTAEIRATVERLRKQRADESEVPK